MVALYYDVGSVILDRQIQEGWGARVIDRLSLGLRKTFPDMKGFSPRNLKYMRAFAAAWPDRSIVQEDFYIDLLFYHLKLRCYVVIELKAVPFDASFLGKLNFYLSAVDDLLRHPDDKPTIGLLLCKSKNKVLVDYALRGFNRPIGISNWETEIVKTLPQELKGSLPSIEELENELSKNSKRKVSAR